MNFVESVLEGGEQKIILKFNDIVRIGIKASEALEELIASGGDIKKIRALEKDSDDIAFEITKDITSGAIAPNLIDNMLDLVNKEDNIIDCEYNLARELLRYNINNRRLDKKIKLKLIEMTRLARSALLIMEKMHKSDKINEISTYRKEIEKLEEAGDEIKDGLFDDVYKEKLDFKTFYHIMELAHQADDILDNCEDSSDIFLTIMSSIIS
ncbi:MAG: DUF47 domain-containing protein [Candidatus Micrarchaeia archaeon]